MVMGNVGRWLATLMVVGLIGAGCTPAAPTPSPSPSVRQTPTETAEERQQRVDYEAAEKSYRAFRAEYNRVLRAGGAEEPTAVMKANAGGTYLRDFADVLKATKGLGDHDEGEEKVVYVRPAGHSPKSLLLDVCEDSRGVTTIDKNGKRVGDGEVRTARVEAQKRGASWMLWSGQGKKVPTCE